MNKPRQQDDRPRRPWPRRLLRAGLLAAGLLALVVWIVKTFVLPGLIADRICTRYAASGAGTAKVGGVYVGWFGSVSLSGLELSLPDGRKGLTCDHLTLGLRNWPGSEPVVTAMEAEGLSLMAYIEEAPAAGPSQGTMRDLLRQFDLRHVRIRGASVHLVQPDRNDTLTFAEIVGDDAGGPFSFRAEGSAPWGAPVVVTGRVRLLSEKGYRAAELRQCSLTMNGRTVLESCDGMLDDSLPGGFAFSELGGLLCGGRWTGSAQGATGEDRKLRWVGQFAAERVNLPDLAAALGSRRKMDSGQATFRLALKGEGLA